MDFPITNFRRALVNWYRRNGRDLPWRRTRDPYAILVSEFMLHQTQVVTAIPYYYEWLRRFPDFVSLARASETEVLLAWQGLGYYARARNLHATARAVLDEDDGQFPRSIERMQRLPGIGKYTAHAVTVFALNQSVPIVEANTARVLARLFNVRESIDSAAGRQKLWRYASKLVPNSKARMYNSALLDLGALICLARKPKCSICPVKNFCRAKNPAALPIKKPRPRTKRLTEEHAFIFRRGRILLEQSRHRWRGMWILPPLQLDCFKQSSSRRRVYETVFLFTNHRVTLSVYAQTGITMNHGRQRWIRAELLESLPVPSPHRKALRHLLSEATAARGRQQQSLTS